jgi:hypothetical protein
MAAALATVVSASPAFAASTDEKSFAINATVANECSVEQPGDVTIDVKINQDPGQNALLINDQSTASEQVWMSCNYPTSIKLTSANIGLKTSSPVGPDTGDFTDKINYVLQLIPEHGSGIWGIDTTKLNTYNGAASVSTTTTYAFHSHSTLQVDILPGDDNNAKRPVAGDYTDTATISLGAV